MMIADRARFPPQVTGAARNLPGIVRVSRAQVRISASAKKGVGVYSGGANTALDKLQSSSDGSNRTEKLSWYYTWSASSNDVAGQGRSVNSSMEYVPMIWTGNTTLPDAQGGDRELKTDLDRIAQNVPILLGFNEPDNRDQANISSSDALKAWQQLEKKNPGRLGSPATQGRANIQGGWMDRFMNGKVQRVNGSQTTPRVDFICLHWYSAEHADMTSRNAAESNAQELADYCTNCYNMYGKTIWLTEFAMINYFPGATTRYPKEPIQDDFIRRAVSKLEQLPFVERYAWFAIEGDTGLYANGALTSAGYAYWYAHR